MEFLDPAAKKARTIRLFTGYALLAIVVALATTILVFQAQGFGYDPNKGVVQNSLLFIDSKPVSSTITLNDKVLSDKTAARLSIGEGRHSVKLAADKYRGWSKNITVERGSVEYLLYPRLFPQDIAIGVTRVFPVAPAWASQSPDRNWLVLQQKAGDQQLLLIDTQKPTEDPVVSTLPASVLPSKNGSFGSLAPLEWASDNKHLLLLQTFSDGSANYIMFNREKAETSINLSATLKLQPGQTITLRDKKFDKFYVLTGATGELRSAETKTGIVAQPILTGVVAYKTHANNIITYVTYAGAKATEARVLVLEDQKNNYALRPVKRDPNNQYLLDQAKFDGDWYYVIGTPSANLVRVYVNPLSKVKPNTSAQASPQTSLLVASPKYVSFSENTRFIAVQSGKSFAVYDAEQARTYRYTSPLNIAPEQKAKWMDGHRFSVVTDNVVQVFEFDGANITGLVASKPEYTPFFDRDYEVLYTLVPQADGKVGFQNAKLIVQQ